MYFRETLCFVIGAIFMWSVHKWWLNSRKTPKTNRDLFSVNYSVFSVNYSGKGTAADVLSESGITDSIDNKDNVLMRLSMLSEMKHKKDFIIFKDKTMRFVFVDDIFNIDKTKQLSDSEYNKINELKNIIQNNGIHCCPDGDPGTYWLITTENDPPINFYGSAPKSDGLDAAFKFKKICALHTTTQF